MNSLVIDTATDRTSCAVFINDELAFYEFHDGATEHAEALPKLVANALLESNQIDQVIVGMGPGPFTGLRTGIVFAQSFAFAQGLPVHGICSLDAIAYGIELPEFIVATDARRKELYWAKYVDGKRVGEPLVTAPSEIPTLPLFGEGALKYELTTDTEHLYPKLISFPKLIHVNEPMYLRHPDAVPTAERK